MSLMGWGELVFAGTMAVAGIGFMVLSHQAEGTAGLIRAAIGSIQAAREQYDAEKGAAAFTLKIEGRDNRSYQPVNGEYPVLGEHQGGGFLLEASGGRYVSACRSTACAASPRRTPKRAMLTSISWAVSWTCMWMGRSSSSARRRIRFSESSPTVYGAWGANAVVTSGELRSRSWTSVSN